MPDDPIGAVANAVTDGLVKTGQAGAIIEFGALWSGFVAFTLTALTTYPVTLVLQILASILCAVGGVALAFRIISNLGR